MSNTFKDFEREGWQQVAGTYHDSFATVTGQAIAPLLAALGMRAGLRLLDVACGSGTLTAAAAAAGADAQGVDLVEKMVAEATHRYPQCIFQQGDAEALPFEPGTFEAVVCSFGILHFPRPELAVDEAFRVLASGGRYAFAAWLATDEPTATNLVQAAVQQHGCLEVALPDGPPPRRFGEVMACRAVMGEAGFEDFTAQEIPITVPLASSHSLIPLLMKGTARNRGLLVRQTPEALAQIQAAVAERVREFPTKDGYAVPNPALIISGRKP